MEKSALENLVGMGLGPKICLVKKSASAEPEFPTPDRGSYQDGKFNSEVSLPNDYTLEGYLASEIEVGKSLKAWRTKRNGEEVLGQTVTSPITEIEETSDPKTVVLKTLNSIYTLTHLD